MPQKAAKDMSSTSGCYAGKGNVITSTDTLLSKRDLLVLGSLFLLEASIVVILQSLHIKGETSFDAFLPRTSGMVFLCASGVFLVSSVVFVRRYLEHRRSPSRNFYLLVAMNVVTVVLTAVIAEIAVRAVVRTYYGYEAIGTLVLRPKSWDAIRVHYQKLIRKQRGDLSYHVYDPLLGWTVGPGRQSADGLYWSSPEGIRAPDGNSSFARNADSVDIALLGDSFTFGEEVTYEESYGYHLEQMLGSPFRVLNFGVPGYGLDQMFLRYERDVRPWKPKISIFGFINADLRRTLWVYPFLGNFRWGNPFSKPRLILREEELTNINPPPLLTSDVIFSRGSIAELPLLEYQKDYHQIEWERQFHHFSYLVRLLLSWHASWSDDRVEISEEALVSINAALLKAFVKSATQEGSIPLVVYLPAYGEIEKPRVVSISKQVLERAGIAYVDPTSCLQEVNPSDRFVNKGHYQSQGNAAIAKCLLPAIHQVMEQSAVDGRTVVSPSLPHPK